MEYKFRGKDRYGKWHYGFLDYRDTSIQIHVVEDMPPTMQDPCGDLYSKYFTVIPETVGQFIGLQDKHKIDIYSGDKIQFYTREMIKRSGIVKFKSCSFYIDDEDGASYYAWDDYSMIEIIGNIHEK